MENSLKLYTSAWNRSRGEGGGGTGDTSSLLDADVAALEGRCETLCDPQRFIFLTRG